MKRQFVITRTVCQTEIPALLDSWVTNTPSVERLCPQNDCIFLYFHKNITCLSVGLLGIGQVFFVSAVNLCVGGLRQIAVS
jgi:hypothetical protein